jgi:hypothetical protein
MLLADDVHAQLDAFIADENRRPGDELSDLMLALSAERTVEGVLGIAAARFGHGHPIEPASGRTRVIPAAATDANCGFNMSIGFRSTNSYAKPVPKPVNKIGTGGGMYSLRRTDPG